MDEDLARIEVRVQAEDFDPGAEITALEGRGGGAVSCFVGLVRDLSGDFPVDHIELEHYPGMAEASLRGIARQALARWPLLGLRIVHRYGVLAARDRIVLVAAASAHRDDAFGACRFVMDYLKTEAPFWKRECGAAQSRWVAARAADEQARRAWEQAPPAA